MAENSIALTFETYLCRRLKLLRLGPLRNLGLTVVVVGAAIRCVMLSPDGAARAVETAAVTAHCVSDRRESGAATTKTTIERVDARDEPMWQVVVGTATLVLRAKKTLSCDEKFWCAGQWGKLLCSKAGPTIYPPCSGTGTPTCGLDQDPQHDNESMKLHSAILLW